MGKGEQGDNNQRGDSTMDYPKSQILNFQIPNLKFQIPNSKIQIPNNKFQIPKFQGQIKTQMCSKTGASSGQGG